MGEAPGRPGEAGLLGQIWPVLFLPLILAYLYRRILPVEEALLQNRTACMKSRGRTPGAFFLYPRQSCGGGREDGDSLGYWERAPRLSPHLQVELPGREERTRRAPVLRATYLRKLFVHSPSFLCCHPPTSWGPGRHAPAMLGLSEGEGGLSSRGCKSCAADGAVLGQEREVRHPTVC